MLDHFELVQPKLLLAHVLTDALPNKVECGGEDKGHACDMQLARRCIRPRDPGISLRYPLRRDQRALVAQYKMTGRQPRGLTSVR